MAYRNDLLDRLGIALPILQASLPGVASPALAAAISASGGLGALGDGGDTPAALARLIGETRERHDGAIAIALSCAASPPADPAADAAWFEALRPEFDRLDTAPPRAGHAGAAQPPLDGDMLRMLLTVAPRAVVFRGGLPPPQAVAALRDAGIVLLGCATSPEEGRSLAGAGMDAIVAQGWEAGGPRGSFLAGEDDAGLGTLALVRMLSRNLLLPVIAAGGLMDGAGVAASLRLGAVAAQLGTAFIACPESKADPAYRAALAGEGNCHTTMTRAVDGRPARCLPNRLTALEARFCGLASPGPGLAAMLSQSLHLAARRRGMTFDYAPCWAGQGAPLSRPVPARDLMRVLADEASRSP